MHKCTHTHIKFETNRGCNSYACMHAFLQQKHDKHNKEGPFAMLPAEWNVLNKPKAAAAARLNLRGVRTSSLWFPESK